MNPRCSAAVVTSWSPISLLLEREDEFAAQYSIVQFPLDPNNPGYFHTWKASAAAPLLVFDAEHSGAVTSAKQLFGDWTFGGSKVAMQEADTAATDAGSRISGPYWKNGFAALTQLDADSSGRIEGEELRPLSLWFDGNRDGVADAGEVKPVTEAGITTLYYDVDKEDPATRAVTVTKGWERVIDGKVSSGAAVDWYSASAPTKELLILNQTAADYLCKADRTEAADYIPSPAAAPAAAPEFDGMWEWHGDKAEVQPGGILYFLEKDKQTVGFSMVEAPLNSAYAASVDAKSIALTARLSDIAKESSRKLAFKVVTPSTVTTSTAILVSPDEIRGESTVSATGDVSGEAYKYAWTARKIPLQR